MGRRKKSKRRGATGRTWKRKDSPTLMPSYNLAPMAPLTGIPVPQTVDPAGMLTVINPDLGTKNGHRYCSARCGCGCKMIVEVRVAHFRTGKASCPTRRKEQKRVHMVGKEHIEKMKLLGRILDPTAALPAIAVTAAAQRFREGGQGKESQGLKRLGWCSFSETCSRIIMLDYGESPHSRLHAGKKKGWLL